VELTKLYFMKRLDFSEQSVALIEAAVDDVHYSMPGGKTPDVVGQLARLWGSYIGEVFRRQVGAEWVVWEDEHGRTAAVQRAGQIVFPHDKVRKRLEQGGAHNLRDYFATYRSLMAAGGDPPSH
jgi:hypothetical protein